MAYGNIPRTCGFCGAPFMAPSASVAKGMGKYCGLTCARRGRGDKPPVQCKCEHCEGLFQAFASRIRLGKDRFCSPSCANDARRKERTPRPCDHCGTVVTLLPFRMRRKTFLCSKVCRANHQKNGEFLSCEYCGDEMYVRPWEAGKRFCSPECSSLGYRGSNHHLYVSGICGHDLRHGHEFTPKDKAFIFNRDNFTCQCCKAQWPNGCVGIQVDHIIPIFEGGTNDRSNGQTLCESCHKSKSASENSQRMTALLETT